MVVAVQPTRKSPRAISLAAVRPDVGPLVEECAVEALDLAVGLRPVGAAVAVPDAGHGQGLVEQLPPITEAVVRQHALDDDAAGAEPRLRPAPERCRGAPLLVGQH